MPKSVRETPAGGVKARRRVDEVVVTLVRAAADGAPAGVRRHVALGLIVVCMGRGCGRCMEHSNNASIEC